MATEIFWTGFLDADRFNRQGQVKGNAKLMLSCYVPLQWQ